MTDLPIACMLTPDALRTRREGLLLELVRRAEHTERLSEGLRLQFAASSETLAMITRTIDAERLCCRFLKFTVTVEPDGGAIRLELSGPRGTGEFVEALLDL